MSEITAAHKTADAANKLPAGSIGLFDTTSSTLANVAPALSVFLTIPAIVASMGSMAPWAFVFAAIAILATGNSLIEYTRRMPSAGGFISYLTRSATGSKPATVLGSMTFYLLLFIYPVSISSTVVFTGLWATGYANWSPGTWIWITLGAMAITVPVLLRGTGVSVKAAFTLFASEAVILVVFAIVILIHARGAIATPFHSIGGSPGGFAGIGGLTFGLAVFAYVGWENSGPLAEESRDPRRTIPRTVVLSVGIVMVVFFLAAYALVVGWAGWKGGAKGMTALIGDPNPYLTLTSHYANWLHLLMFLIGITSSVGAFVAAALPGSRYIFHGDRAGLLPRGFARVSPRTGVPYASILVYISGTILTTVILDLIFRNAANISTWEAGISTVPLLIIYGATCVMLPFFVWRTDRGTFSPVRHVLVPLVGVGVMGYGVWMSIKPSQPGVAGKYWIYVLAYLVVAGLGALYALRSHRVKAQALAAGLD